MRQDKPKEDKPKKQKEVLKDKCLRCIEKCKQLKSTKILQCPNYKGIQK